MLSRLGLLLCRRVPPTHTNKCPGYDIKQSDVEIQVILLYYLNLNIRFEEWGVLLHCHRSQVHSGSTWSGQNRNIGQIELNCVLMLNWIVWYLDCLLVLDWIVWNENVFVCSTELSEIMFPWHYFVLLLKEIHFLSPFQSCPSYPMWKVLQDSIKLFFYPFFSRFFIVVFLFVFKLFPWILLLQASISTRWFIIVSQFQNL